MTEENRTIEDEVSQDDLDKIKERVTEEPDTVSFNASRVPRGISSSYKDLADEQFAGDYGMAMTYVWLQYEQMQSVHERMQHLENRIDRLNQRLESALAASEEEKTDESPVSTLN